MYGQDPSKKEAAAEEQAKRLAPKPKPKYDTVTGKWVVMNYDGSVSGVPGGETINFKDLTREVSELTEPTVCSPSPSLQEFGSVSDGGNNDGSSRSNPQQLLSMVEEHRLRPFARVDAVAADSPAIDAGLKEEDLIVRFGHVHAENNDRLRAIAALVPEVAGEGGEINIELLRRLDDSAEQAQDASNVTVTGSEQDYEDSSKWERISLSLRPRPWSGRGLIGAHVVPFS
jgi:hypothetical protein